jgi:hypothetical protein
MHIDFWNEAFQIVQCRGCEAHSFRQTTCCSEDIDTATGLPETVVTEYPGKPAAKNGLDSHELKPFPNVALGPRRIYRETVEAYNRELYTLAAGGLRAIIEAICADRSITDGPCEVEDKRSGEKRIERRTDLRAKIHGMAERGVLTKAHADTLHEHRFLGNKALHELRTPSPDDLSVALAIVEHTLETIYELPKKGAALALSRATPPEG